ncbi:hypothetical protein ACFX1S_042016 [Malus domestica]
MPANSSRHLTQLAHKGGNPFDFKFVEHHKVHMFIRHVFIARAVKLISTVTSSGNESMEFGRRTLPSTQVISTSISRPC